MFALFFLFSASLYEASPAEWDICGPEAVLHFPMSAGNLLRGPSLGQKIKINKNQRIYLFSVSVLEFQIDTFAAKTRGK